MFEEFSTKITVVICETLSAEYIYIKILKEELNALFLSSEF